MGTVIYYHLAMLAQTTQPVGPGPFIQDPVGVLAVLLAVLALIFWLTEYRHTARLFKVEGNNINLFH